jgi:hypothetical protein
LQELVTPAGAKGPAATEPVTGTQEFWQFMATVSQLIMQVAYPGVPSNWGVVGTGNWGGVKGIGGVIPVDGGATACCWASALPVSRANPSATTADDLIVFIVSLLSETSVLHSR